MRRPLCCSIYKSVVISSSIASIFFFGPMGWAATEVSGRATLAAPYFLSTPSSKPAHLQGMTFPLGRIEVEPSLQIATESARFRLKGIFGYDYTYIESSERRILIPQELFAELRSGDWNILAGINTYNWGVTDFANPLDVVSPRSFRNPFSPVKIGSPSLSIAKSWDGFALELVYIPRQFPHELPPANSRFLPRDTSFADYASKFQDLGPSFVFPTDPLVFSYEAPEVFGRALDHNMGLRLRLQNRRLESHLVLFEGMPTFPEPIPNLEIVPLSLSPPVNTMSTKVPITPRYERMRIAGAGFVYSGESFIAKFAYAKTWRASIDPELPAGYSSSLPETGVLAFEKSLNKGNFEWTFLAQTMMQKNLSASAAASSELSVQRILDGSTMLGLRLARGVDFNLLLGGLYSPKSLAQLYTSEMSYRTTESSQAKLSALIVRGPPGSLARAIESSSYLELSYHVFW